ncbi:hypothetical protein GUITHDRAFT_164343 [Guillardia theta CCMP2712]|uniref:Uncharacterized protein n=1 Tax=Guillardia theta (strain CCMP2712) TaxID=905079 RepID=L1IZG0_GUITC|nr:hypothetical protein GUITHDRAFT_164343 [Guillardia theta CCMP2712]EKX41636.1 hypothetical protein GUITHDRAFT_164343 [Guillardia theta CCMP2712]|eukprot:XP_005828616.1 hypothetical protein GUITHDRAFT_164343 [Guillardia theta CCMP2712]
MFTPGMLRSAVTMASLGAVMAFVTCPVGPSSAMKGKTSVASSMLQLRRNAPPSLDCSMKQDVPESRRELLSNFVQAGAGLLVSSLPLPSFAATKEELKCRAAIGGGQRCEGSKNVEFKKAFETVAGGQVKVTGDPNKVSTYLSQIDAGYQTLVELQEKWDGYIAAGDGDVIRRRLGTVGNKSPLFNIRKAFEGAMKACARRSDISGEELDELEEEFNIILSLIAEVDYNLYSTGYVGTDETASTLRENGKSALDRVLSKYEKFDKAIERFAKAE